MTLMCELLAYKVGMRIYIYIDAIYGVPIYRGTIYIGLYIGALYIGPYIGVLYIGLYIQGLSI